MVRPVALKIIARLNTHPPNFKSVDASEPELLRLHPQRVARVVRRAPSYGGLVVEYDERHRCFPADGFELLGAGLKLFVVIFVK